MDDVTWPSISSKADETLAQLDALHAPYRQRRQEATTSLTTAVARLGESSEPWRDEEAFNPASTMQGGGQQPSPPTPMPFVPLPERTTHGGGFGPKVRAKLIAEALERR